MNTFIHRSIGFLVALAFLAGCTTPGNQTVGEKQEHVLQIRWQRLVDEKGQTCDRCGTTEQAIEHAAKKLRKALKNVAIQVVLTKTNLSASAFAKDPLESNRIWIADKPIEEWLGATIGRSQCSGTCGDSECRTITIDGQTYESIPAALILKAGLLAGASLIQGQPQNPWNPTAGWSKPPACCPQPSEGQKK